ncbi:hypothetical protein P22_1470 [Propionispora sp. 2/2-37]|uniref:PTS sugar transporter subunit IIA n=1 Tax=Propionispora sp. 2/2-37 TaxID=1677858 RepID=UPI0006BB6463|nr:PTS sugar transporter subunit IIA [Propionispora sp. 2/2-37]CUH95400.1 hypothetical protein P22_1470 [Propionispora sp. 2/2-37]
MNRLAKDSLLTLESIHIGMPQQDRYEVLKVLSDSLKEQGFVTDGHYDALLKREMHFPTGIPAGQFGIAIPHTDPAYVRQAAIAVGILAHPVVFYQMGAETTEVEVQMVFLLALTQANKQINMLQNITRLIRDGEALAFIRHSTSREEIRNKLQSFLD